MIVAGSASPLLLSSAGGYNLTKSLRFRSSASAYLNRTPASASNRQKWTWSGWVKRGELSPGVNFKSLFGAGISGSDRSELFFYDDKISVTNVISGVDYNLNSTAVFRDTGAWYHVVLSTDTTQSTAANRVKIYINNANVDISGSYPTQNVNLAVNNTVVHYIGENGGLGRYFDGYMADINFIDGQALTPSSFGQTSPTTGVWQPRRYTGTYGTNGFYLPFTNTTSTSTLGNDFSGNNNTWTVNNISLTSGSTYDSMNDVPTLTNATTANYCVINSLRRNVCTISNGNLTASGPITYTKSVVASMSMPSGSGKWYWEGTATRAGTSNGDWVAGIVSTTWNPGEATGTPSVFPGNTSDSWGVTGNSGNKINNNSSTAYGGTTIANGDVVMVAYDAVNGSFYVGKNGTWFNSGNPATNTNYAFTGITTEVLPAFGLAYDTGSSVVDANFGQRPFAYTPPTGFVALNTFNLPTPTIGATASTTANKYFDALLYTGNGSASQRTDISWANMQPDMVWIKNRTSANNHVLHDDIRGTNAALQPNLTNATDSPVGFGTDGFGFDGVANQLRIFTSDGRYNTNGNAYVTWGWKGSGAAGVTNTAGSITSTVSANTTAGFSIATYTGNGSTGATIGHGLGVTPSMVIVKKRSSTGNWITYHTSTGINQYLYLNSTSASNTASPTWGVSSTTVTFQQAFSDYNDNGVTYVAYCFAQIAGYSAFGSYTGNGSTDGPFVFTGFRPRFLLVKRTNGIQNWTIYDSARDTYNVEQNLLAPNTSGAEAVYAIYDFLSNGFKIRNTDNAFNASGGTYIYMAFAESPFKYANAR